MLTTALFIGISALLCVGGIRYAVVRVRRHEQQFQTRLHYFAVQQMQQALEDRRELTLH